MQAAADAPVTAARLLDDARNLGVPRLDAMALLSHHGRVTRTWLIAHDDEPLPSAMIESVRADLARRAAGEPLAYLVGRREFRGLEFEVTPDVLIPRPETECLVDWALEVGLPSLGMGPSVTPGRLKPLAARGSEPCERAGPSTPFEAQRHQPENERSVIVDLGTGSGAVAIALAHATAQARMDAEVHAVDSSRAAIAVARRNAQTLGVAIAFHVGDWWRAAGLLALRRRVTLAVSNPPYVRAGDPHLAALVHEPSLALLGGDDGLEAIRTIVRDAHDYLAPGGRLLLEHGFDQGEAVRDLLHRHGFVSVATRRDLAGHERCSGARRAP